MAGYIIHKISTILFAISCVSTSALSVPMMGGSSSTSFTMAATHTKDLPLEMTLQHPSESLQSHQQNAVAIILNTNARSVVKEMAPLAQSIFGAKHVFLTSNHEEAKYAAMAALDYKLVIPVGGDGTLSSLINEMCHILLSRQEARNGLDNATNTNTLGDAMKKLPLFGYIPMGTGNGVGSVVGCRLPGRRGLGVLFQSKSRHRLRQLKLVLERLYTVGQALQLDDHNKPIADADFSIVNMPMIQIQSHAKDQLQPCATTNTTATNGALCFFAGVGFDSLMLNDFKALKAWSQRSGILKRALGSVAGYCVALITMTLPQCVFQNKHKIHVTLTTRCSNYTLWIDHRRGDFAQGVDDQQQNPNTSTLLYQGPAGILAAGTSPFYGGGLRLFPFARLYPDRMHLRLGRIHPIKGFLNIPKIFEGSYRDDDFGCLDFIGKDFDIEVRQDHEHQKQKGYPFQHSGESAGHLERFRLRLEEEPVRFVSFLPQRLIVADKE